MELHCSKVPAHQGRKHEESCAPEELSSLGPMEYWDLPDHWTWEQFVIKEVGEAPRRPETISRLAGRVLGACGVQEFLPRTWGMAAD